MRVGCVQDDRFKDHHPPAPHPECPERLQSIERRLDESGLGDKLTRIAGRPATDEEILRVHTKELLATLDKTNRAEHTQLDADTYACDASYEVARFAAGSTINAIDHLVTDRLDTAFLLVRPPGHHAEKNRAMGFCLLNHVAIGAAHALIKHRKERVAIIDWDVHHGNGTEEIFYKEPRVLYISSHQHPLYPGTGGSNRLGEGPGRLCNLNLPLPAGLAEEDIISVYNHLVLPALRSFAPDILFISAGFDAHQDDPLGGLNLSILGFSKLTAILESLRKNIKHLKTMYLLEGGYNLAALAASTEAVFTALLEDHHRTLGDAPTKTHFCKQLIRGYPNEVAKRWNWS